MTDKTLEIVNEAEAEVVAKMVKALLVSGKVLGSRIGVVTYFERQKKLISEMIIKRY